jgi:hypothetical protein
VNDEIAVKTLNVSVSGEVRRVPPGKSPHREAQLCFRPEKVRRQIYRIEKKGTPLGTGMCSDSTTAHRML